MQLVSFERKRVPESGAGERIGSMGDGSLGLEALAGARRLGALIAEGSHAGQVVDLNRALAIRLAFDDVGAPEAEADSLLPPEPLGFLRRLPASLETAARALDFVMDALDRYDAPDLLRAGVVEDRRRLRLCAPVPRPGKILGVARNYPAHAAERGASPPQEPVLFLKAPSAVIGPEDEIRLPAASTQVDFEGELAVVIGRSARQVSADEALEHVAGYCVANDVSARDFQNVRGQHFIGKSCDGFCPLGPSLVTADEVPEPQALWLKTSVSGQLFQSASTGDMLFPVTEIVSFASQLLTLEPGDVILTGTPPGVGAAQRPPRFLGDGDLVEVEIERLGRLKSYVRSAASGR